jgi:hypothetical protein
MTDAAELPATDIEARAQWIKLRRLEIASTLAEWKRQWFVDGIEHTMAERSTLEAEDARLALEARVISSAAVHAKVERRRRQVTECTAALALLSEKTGALIQHLQSTGRLQPCFNFPALDEAKALLARVEAEKS